MNHNLKLNDKTNQYSLETLYAIFSEPNADIDLQSLSFLLSKVSFFELSESLQNNIRSFVLKRFNHDLKIWNTDKISLENKLEAEPLCKLTEELFCSLWNKTKKTIEYFADYPISTGINCFSGLKVEVNLCPDLEEYMDIKGDGVICAFIKQSFVNSYGQLFFAGHFYVLKLSEDVANCIKTQSALNFINNHFVEIMGYFSSSKKPILAMTNLGDFLQALFTNLFRYTHEINWRELSVKAKSSKVLSHEEVSFIKEFLQKSILQIHQIYSIPGAISISFNRKAIFSDA